ncbi:hypothetical protein D3C81_1439870 [compost metagenome]
MGFRTYEFMPTSRQWRSSSRTVVAVTPTTGIFLSSISSLERIDKVSSKPFMIGIWQSVSTRSNFSLASANNASCPFSTTLLAQPSKRNCCWTSSRLIGWSSTTRILKDGAGVTSGCATSAIEAPSSTDWLPYRTSVAARKAVQRSGLMLSRGIPDSTR